MKGGVPHLFHPTLATGHIHCKSVNISEMVQEGDAFTAYH